MQNVNKNKSLLSYIYYERYMYLLLVLGLLYFLIFKYLPIFGIVVAFKDYNIFKGIWASTWVGFEHFETLFTSVKFWEVLRNTILISAYKIVSGFSIPIIFALLLNEIKNIYFKRTVQTILYLPHFISWVVIGGMMLSLMSLEYGMLKDIFKLFDIAPFNILASSKYFRSVLVITDIWRGAGWGIIIYLAALNNIDLNLYESAKIDGAGRLKQAWHITLPGIMSVMVLVLILDIGRLMNAGFEQVISLYNYIVFDVADIFDTYIYRVGLGGGQYSFTTAVGLFKSVVATILIAMADRVSKLVAGEGLF